MRTRLPWFLSFGLNAVLTAAAVWLGLRANQAPPPTPAPTSALRGEARTDTAAPALTALVPIAGPPSTRFHWSQIESDDYRQYIANLRAVGCPERLIRDLVVADLGQLYDRRRQANRPPPTPAWAGGDRRRALEAQTKSLVDAVDAEHHAVLRELLGFAWSREAIELWNNEQVAWVLLGFLTDDQAIQVAGLVEPLADEARRVRERVEGILLAEDFDALEQLGARFKTEVAAILTPQQTEEFNLRLQALGLALSGNGVHLETAELTALEVREIVRLSLAQSDFVREELLDLEVPEEEQAARKAAFEAAVAGRLGPARYATFARAQDERFREAYEFSRERQLPPELAVKAWEVRRAAEEEAETLRAAPPGGVDPTAVHQQLQALQESTAVALTSLFGAEHMDRYLEQHGEWLNQLGPPAPAATRGEAE